MHISYLQTFTDVNKRTARLSANISLLKNNLYPIAFNAMGKDDYISAMLAVYEKNDVTALAELYTASYKYTCEEYRTLFDAMEFDEVRVRFRREIRKLLHDIIMNQYVGTALKEFILNETNNNIPEAYREVFVNRVNQEIENIGPERIVGLGVSKEVFEQWLKLHR